MLQDAPPTPTRTARSPAARRPALRRLAHLPLAVLLLATAACGGGAYVGDGPYDGGYDPPYGSVDVTNYSPEYVMGFYLAPAATGSFTGNLLSSPLPPGTAEWVGDFLEDSYDAEADMEFGDLVQWFDVWVPAYDTTSFDVY